MNPDQGLKPLALGWQLPVEAQAFGNASLITALGLSSLESDLDLYSGQ